MRTRSALERAPEPKPVFTRVMRRYIDADGRAWDVVVGRESWGALLALFIPSGRDRDRAVRQTMLDAAGYGDAQIALAGLDDAELARLFERSNEKND